LSEAAVLAFEYGYSLDCPDGLVLWEAQYGDFVNAAQVIIDQFLAAAEHKWQRLSGLVLLLPHGLEGAGPEHSSARLERFLQLAAEDNLQIVYPTTPAQYFHVLRRQILRRLRKPLVVMTPKSLLRNPAATSSIEELSSGRFQRIIPDSTGSNDIKRILLCSGKVFYDLDAARKQGGPGRVALIRLEQLYPLQDDALRALLQPYPPETPVFWVQEEPQNMGAWRFLHSRFGDRIFGQRPFNVISRPAAASPATGSASSHRLEQQQLIANAFQL
jgi:2-oxoglutarate dehydrogenase E1 component